MLEAAIDALRSGKTLYTAVSGTIELRNAIADDLRIRRGASYDPVTEIVVGNGAKQCVYQALLASCGHGDGVVIPAPYWPSYPEMALLVGADPIILETSADDGYLINPQSLDQCLADHPRAKALILCNPSNPTRGVHSTELLFESRRYWRIIRTSW